MVFFLTQIYLIIDNEHHLARLSIRFKEVKDAYLTCLYNRFVYCFDKLQNTRIIKLNLLQNYKSCTVWPLIAFLH